MTIPFDEWETLYRERLQIDATSWRARARNPIGCRLSAGASATTETEQVAAPLEAGEGGLHRGTTVATGALGMLVGFGVSQLLERIVGARGGGTGGAGHRQPHAGSGKQG